MPELRSTWLLFFWLDPDQSNDRSIGRSSNSEQHAGKWRWWLIPYCSWASETQVHHVMLYAVLNVSTQTTTHWAHHSTLARYWPKFDGMSLNVCDFPKQTCTMCMIFPTLSQTKPRKNPRLQYAFNIQVLVVFCNSHWLSHLAAIFIDKRAEWSTVYSRIFSTIFISSRETEGYHWVPHRLAHIWHWHIRMIGVNNAIRMHPTSAAIGRLLIESSNLIGPYHMRHVSDQLHRLADQTPKLTTLCKYAIRDWQPIIRQTRH